MKRTGALLLALALALGACSGDDDEASSDGTTGTTADGAGDSGDSGGEATFPVTVEHRYGETTFDAAPERIVSIDTQWTDVLTALDAPLVGAALDPTVEGGRYPWQDVIADDVEAIEVGDAIPFESVAALQPDLIVVTWAITEESTYDTLSEIAPTIPLLGEREVDQWQDIAAVAGDVLGVPDEAAALVEESEALTAGVLEELPGLEGHTVAMANYVPGDAIYVVADPEDGASTFFRQLGIEVDPELVELADGAAGRAELSLEQVELLDSDLLILLTNGADPSEIPGYDNLPAVESGAVAVLDVPTITGLNTPSALSVPYALDAIRPALEALDAS